MIVLDTNVISALMQSHLDAGVEAWLNRQPGPSMWTTSVSVLEIRSGILLLPEGRRKDALYDGFGRLLAGILSGRVLPFDLAAAARASDIYAGRYRKGINKETRDLQIAGIVMSRDATLATRNVRDFQDLDIPLVNPWES